MAATTSGLAGSQRRRAPNKLRPTVLTAVDPDDKPEIPRIPAGLDLTPQAKRRWREIWSDPITAVYAKIDQPAVERLVRLYSIADVETNTRNLIDISRECRALESQLAASPRARAQLKLEYERGDAADERLTRRQNRRVTEVVTPAANAETETLTRDEMLARVREMTG